MSKNSNDIIKGLCGNQMLLNSKSLSAKDVIICACFLRRYITLKQIGLLLKGYPDGTLRKYISDLSKQGYVRSGSQRAIGNVSVYSITSQGIAYATELLSSMLPDGVVAIEGLAGTGYSDLPAKVDKPSHRTYANDMYFYLASQYGKRFLCAKEQPIDRYGRLIEKSDSAATFNYKDVIPDGYFRICVYNAEQLPMDYVIYEEQDMDTQTEGAIKSKLQKYENTVLSHIDDIVNHEICFCLNTKKEVKKAKSDSKDGISDSVSLMVRAFMISTGVADPDVELFLKHFKSTDHELIRELIGARRYLQLKQFATKIKHECRPSDSLLSYLNTDNSDNEEMFIDASYIKRRNMFFRYLKNLPELTHYIYEGFNVTTVSNANMDVHFKYSHPGLHITDDVAAVLSKYFGEIRQSNEIRINGILFTDTYDSNMDSSIICENISDSLSGFMRMEKLFEKGYNIKEYTVMSAYSIKDMARFVRTFNDHLLKMLYTDRIPDVEHLSGYPLFILYTDAGMDDSIYVPIRYDDGIYFVKYGGDFNERYK